MRESRTGGIGRPAEGRPAEGRLQFLNRKKVRKGRYVLYWMQQSQRSVCNHALEYGIVRANALSTSLIVIFVVTPNFPEANRRHYAFMLEGLAEARDALRERGIGMEILVGHPGEIVVEAARDASLLVTDRGYLRVQRRWRQTVAEAVACQMVQVESDVVVPAQEASTKEEYTAGTFRPRIQSKIHDYLRLPGENRLYKDSLALSPNVPGRRIAESAAEERERASTETDPMQGSSRRSGRKGFVLSLTPPQEEVRPLCWLRGGQSRAGELLERFIREKLDFFADGRNDPSGDYLSHMSPYLHFGQISPVYIVHSILASGSPGRDAYLEELVVRRELAVNFVLFNPAYDSIDCLPNWAQATLGEHAEDPREHLYTLEELGSGQTHDPYWNAAQREMVHLGKMHGYMRMYWGKKILEWTGNPEEGYRYALRLNNMYSLDGRDPNGFAGIAWCFGKHDRAWQERRVFGKIRYMNDRGLKRKFDIDGYVKRVDRAVARERAEE
jgi:deoxyribodipyrimidine photo-lyase